ncbi:hypothetical protein EVAR_64631_1 [Eumeta japonica]|uniref:Histone-lysine N-methyltransferase SETMAR n=1 Tax=Eumeta variegata TaxID=151549 RepID=A0A4C1Z834_EUMVA|nr:hypothetical protein EVAR_64631_1 [Eumeta japonica]
MREGRFSTAMTEYNISDVRFMIETDKRVTYQQIRTILGIGMSQMHKILHEYLAVRKLCIRWIPHNLTEAQKLCHINWYREIMQRFAGAGCIGKNMVASFFIITGHFATIVLENKKESLQTGTLTIVCILFRKKFEKNDLAVRFSFIMTTSQHIPPDKELTIWGR